MAIHTNKMKESSFWIGNNQDELKVWLLNAVIAVEHDRLQILHYFYLDVLLPPRCSTARYLILWTLLVFHQLYRQFFKVLTELVLLANCLCSRKILCQKIWSDLPMTVKFFRCFSSPRYGQVSWGNIWLNIWHSLPSRLKNPLIQLFKYLALYFPQCAPFEVTPDCSVAPMSIKSLFLVLV
jgi:hypothetical protein